MFYGRNTDLSAASGLRPQTFFLRRLTVSAICCTNTPIGFASSAYTPNKRRCQISAATEGTNSCGKDIVDVVFEDGSLGFSQTLNFGQSFLGARNQSTRGAGASPAGGAGFAVET